MISLAVAVTVRSLGFELQHGSESYLNPDALKRLDARHEGQ